jgi:hypothetical protein
MIETSSSNVDLIGTFVVLIGQRRSTATAKRPPRSRLRLISAWRSLYELELRMFYCDPGYCLSSGGSPAVSTVTIRPNTDLGRGAKTHLATITAPSNFILSHASHSKLGTSDRNSDDFFAGRIQSLTISRKPVGVGAAYQRLIPTGERSGLQTHIGTTEGVSLCERKKS